MIERAFAAKSNEKQCIFKTPEFTAREFLKLQLTKYIFSQVR